MKQQQKKALLSAEITLPHITDKSVSHTQPNQTGGVIGTARYFKVEISTKKVEKIEPEPVNTTGEPEAVQPSEQQSGSVLGIGVIVLILFVLGMVIFRRK